jgi:glycine cleavage system H lipoate-binding protein
VSGEVSEINTALNDNAPLVNSASFTDEWMIKIILVDVTDADTFRRKGIRGLSELK